MDRDFSNLTALRDQWQALQPLSAETQARLWKKLRLEWNYHSNHIEGNTLTYGETELLLLHDRTTGNHSHREYLEMKAHDVGIEHVRTLAADSARVITESDVRDLNKIILKEPFWKPAETAEGLATRKEIIPGQYKTTPNNVRLQNGDIFYFASVEDTAPKMQALAEWLQAELEAPTMHPVVLAAKLHHDFVLIHPFDDGNGRVARLLVNYVLMRSGFLPVIVRTNDKQNYLTALRLADAGELSALVSYLFSLAEWSLKLGIKAAKGESIEEPSDVEKEVEIFIRQQQAPADRVVARSEDSVRKVFQDSILPLLSVIDSKLKKLTPLFANQSVVFAPIVGSFRTDSAVGALEWILNELHAQDVPGLQLTQALSAEYQFRGYRGDANEPFGVVVAVQIHFHDFQYGIGSSLSPDIRKLYSEPITSDEMEAVATGLLADAFGQVKSHPSNAKL